MSTLGTVGRDNSGRSWRSRMHAHAMLYAVVGLVLVDCGGMQVMDRKTSPDGTTEAVVVGLVSRVDYRNVELRDTRNPSHRAVVFRSENSRIATRWLSSTELAIYYSEDGATLIDARPRNYFLGNVGASPQVRVRLRPV